MNKQTNTPIGADETTDSYLHLQADAGAQHSVILAKVPVAYMDDVKRKYVNGVLVVVDCSLHIGGVGLDP